MIEPTLKSGASLAGPPPTCSGQDYAKDRICDLASLVGIEPASAERTLMGAIGNG